jgi:DNA-binding CsgD family transcriptional regulator
VNEALEKFARKHPVQAELVKLRYFAGMSNEETAHVLGISVSTVKAYWVFSRAWLYRKSGANRLPESFFKIGRPFEGEISPSQNSKQRSAPPFR